MKQFICQTPSCAIAVSKAEFPVSMNCPVCQTPLTEAVKSLTQKDLELIASLPYVIAYPLKRTLLEKHEWTKINLLKDTFLNYLKYLGLLSASEFFNSELKDKGMIALFDSQLRETAFGKWNHFIRECLAYLKKQNHRFFYPELVAYYDWVETKDKKHKGKEEYHDASGDTQVIEKQGISSIGMLINFRNIYLGHGLTLDEVKSSELWDLYYPIFHHLLTQLNFTKDYPMFKCEQGETYLLHSAEIEMVKSKAVTSSNIWIENKAGKAFDILPFFILPGEVSLATDDKDKLLSYESFTGKTIKFFSPEGTEKQTSGKLLEKLNLLLRSKQKETPTTPELFTKDEFLKRIAEENKLLLDTLIAEKKIIPGVYQHREEMEIKLREWIGARANIFFMVAEAGSGKTNLLVEIQKQYTERNLTSLLIRAGRMEKQSLKEQIAYLLNIDLEKGLENYSAIAGTQSEPTFILIDGLNEANNAEVLWQEILSLSTIFELGSLKFVVTSRANTKADLERYLVSDQQQELLYGEIKENEKGLGAYSFWLTALNMAEMKGAWQNYAAKDKARFKPQFSFDVIAGFDRGIYNQINNPLILRLFLEVYNGKVLAKKGSKHLNIWHDWLLTFSEKEQLFFKLLANEVWLKGNGELLLDELLKHDVLKSYFNSDITGDPYPRLKEKGFISAYVKELNTIISFTVEASLLYLIGINLKEQQPAVNLAFVQASLATKNKLQHAAMEAFLCEQALGDNLDILADLIDAGNENLPICIKPLLLFLKSFGIDQTITKVLTKPSDNDWKALFYLDKQLQALQQNELRGDFLRALMPHNDFKTKPALWLGLKAIALFDKEDALAYLAKIDTTVSFVTEDSDLLFQLGRCEDKFANYDKALEYHEKCLAIRLKTLGGEHPDVTVSYINIGSIWNYKGNYDKALEYHEKCLAIRLKILGGEHPALATSYNNIGSTWNRKGNNDKALEYYEKCLAIRLKLLGGEHPSMATSYNNIGKVWDSKGNYDKALEYHEKCLAILLKTLGGGHPRVAISLSNIGSTWNSKGNYDKALEYHEKCLVILLKTLGGGHPNVATSYINIGLSWNNKCNYVKALEYYEKCLAIRLKTLGAEHPDVAILYSNLGDCLKNLEKYLLAIDVFKKGLSIQKVGGFPFKIAQCYEALDQFEEALSYYIQSAEIRKERLGLEATETSEAIANAQRLAKQLGKEKQLPKWIGK
jgi:tetratricopeptide (TPR) repeat protein